MTGRPVPEVTARFTGTAGAVTSGAIGVAEASPDSTEVLPAASSAATA